MTLVSIYERPVLTTYRSTIFSKATLYRVVGVCITLLAPIFIAYRSQGFWLTTSTYIEQPTIEFKKEVLLIANTQNDNSFLGWSTYSNFNSLLGDSLRISTISSYEVDTNGDGLSDHLNLTLQIPLATSESIMNFQMLLFFDYQLSRYSFFEMEAMATVQQQSFSRGAEFTARGDLNLVQKIPLYHRGVDERYNVPLINSTSLSLSEYNIDRIFNVYSQRNITARLENVYSTWKTGRAASAPFVINLQIDYPINMVTYHPGFWEMVKWGWVQYFAIWYLFKIVFDQINDVIFSSQLLSTVMVRPKVKIQ